MNKNMNQPQSSKKQPAVRLRHFVFFVALLMAVCSVPLGIVWKLVYFSGASLRQSVLNERRAVLQKEKVRLSLVVERLSASSRIESIARRDLGLEYPTSDQIVVIRIENTAVTGVEPEFIAIVKNSLAGNKI